MAGVNAGGLIVDNFAGGGGASTGIEAALGRAVDIAINHDAEAIRMHEANHPGTLHIRNNIWQVDPVEAVREAAARREGVPVRDNGVPHVELAWFSPDCKHFSKAKGGKPREKSIRDLAWVVVLWARRVRPDLILLENVEEFRTWGPLCEQGFPIKDRAGELFNAQGFPPTYIIEQDGQGNPITKTAQVAKCGNSVCPDLAEALAWSNAPTTQAAAEVPEAEVA